MKWIVDVDIHAYTTGISGTYIIGGIFGIVVGVGAGAGGDVGGVGGEVLLVLLFYGVSGRAIGSSFFGTSLDTQK